MLVIKCVCVCYGWQHIIHSNFADSRDQHGSTNQLHRMGSEFTGRQSLFAPEWFARVPCQVVGLLNHPQPSVRIRLFLPWIDSGWSAPSIYDWENLSCTAPYSSILNDFPAMLEYTGGYIGISMVWGGWGFSLRPTCFSLLWWLRAKGGVKPVPVVNHRWVFSWIWWKIPADSDKVGICWDGFFSCSVDGCTAGWSWMHIICSFRFHLVHISKHPTMRWVCSSQPDFYDWADWCWLLFDTLPDDCLLHVV